MLKKIALLSAALIALSGCAGYNIDKFNNASMKGKGSSFNTALAKEYKSFVNSEARQYDWNDADHFAQKGLRALNGENVQPENPSVWNLPGYNRNEIENYYQRLSYILNNGAKKSHPESSAKAMAKYDCWVEQQEEDWQPKDIAACRGDFLKAFADLERAEPKLAAAAKKNAAAKPSMMAKKGEAIAPAGNEIYFGLNSATVDAAGRKAAQRIAQSAGKKAKIVVYGHADTSGSSKYNMALSQGRALAVQHLLVAAGIPAKNIRIVAKGDSDLAVQTGPGVKEARNRRAAIAVESGNLF